MADARKMPTAKQKKNKNPHDGSTLDDFLKEEGIYEEVQAAALKRVMAMGIASLMEEKHVKKTTLARRMRTSRAALDRLLDPSNTSVTLSTLTRAATALGCRVKIELVPEEAGRGSRVAEPTVPYRVKRKGTRRSGN